MLKRLRRHLNPALVISVIALFVALGGGYAVAFKGSGTLQKASAVPTSSDTNLRSLNNFGTLQHRCDGSGTIISLNNTTNNSVLLSRFDENNGSYNTATVSAGNKTQLYELVDGIPIKNVRFHLWKATPTNKAQVDVVISGGSINPVCLQTKVLALNTQE